MGTNLFVVKSFLRFLELVGMSGDAEVKDCILDFNKNGVALEAITAFESVAVKGYYSKKEVKNYEPLGKIGVENFGDIKKYLASFNDDEVRITKKENYLLLIGNKKRIKVQLKEFEYIPKVEDGKVNKLLDLGKKNIGLLSKEHVEKIVSNSALLGSKEFKLKREKNRIVYSATSWTQNKIEEQLDVKSGLEEIEITLPEYFTDAIANIKDDIEIGLNKNAPVYVGYKNDLMEVEFAVAPIIKEE